MSLYVGQTATDWHYVLIGIVFMILVPALANHHGARRIYIDNLGDYFSQTKS